MKGGWVKLFRKFTEWEWYKDTPTKAVFIHLLLTANVKPNTWHGIKIPAGSVLTSYEKLAEETGLSVKQTRRAIKNLIRTGEVAAIRATTGAGLKNVKGTLYKLKNWSSYQQRGQL